MELKSKFTLKETVYFMHDNRIRKSTITGIKFPNVWLSNNGRSNNIQTTSFNYVIKLFGNNHPRYGNSGGLPECLLFKTKKDLIKTL